MNKNMKVIQPVIDSGTLSRGLSESISNNADLIGKVKRKRTPKPLINTGTRHLKSLIPMLNLSIIKRPNQEPKLLANDPWGEALEEMRVDKDYGLFWVADLKTHHHQPLVVEALILARRMIKAQSELARSVQSSEQQAYAFSDIRTIADKLNTIREHLKPASLKVNTNGSIAFQNSPTFKRAGATVQELAAMIADAVGLAYLDKNALYFIGHCPRCETIFSKQRGDQVYDKVLCRNEFTRKK